MGRRSHLLKRNDVFWWRRRLPPALVERGGPGELRRSLGTGEPALARLRALKLTTAFEDVLLSHAKILRSAKPLTRWERDQVLGELYDRILDECQEWAAHRTVATEFLEPGDPEWDEDRYFNPGHLASFWTSLYQCGEYAEAADRLKELLAAQRIDLPSDSIEFRSLAAEGMRYAIAAFQEAERTIVAGRLDEGTLARLARRHGRAPTPASSTPVATGKPGQPAALAGLPAQFANDDAAATTSPTLKPVPAPLTLVRAADDQDDPRLPSLETPMREIFKLFVADKTGTSWKPEAVDDACSIRAVARTA